AYEPQGDHLVGQTGPAVLSLVDAELLVEAEQVLLDRRFGDHEHFGDVACGGGCDEGLLRQCGAAQCVQDIELPTGEFGGRAAAQFDVGAELFALEAADPTAGTAEGDHVAFFQDASCDRASVDAGSVAGQAQVDDVDVGASTDEFGVKLSHARVVDTDVGALSSADGGDLVGQRMDVTAFLDTKTWPVHGGHSFGDVALPVRSAVGEGGL